MGGELRVARRGEGEEAGGSTVGAVDRASPPGAGAPGRRCSRAVLQAGRSQVPGHPPPHPSSNGGREGSARSLAAGSEGQLRLLCPQPCCPRAMEPSGSLFPSLVVVGHVVTLAAVWHWRRGRWRVQDVQGKRLWQLPPGPSLGCGQQPPPLLGGWRRGGVRGRLPPASEFPCSLPFLSLR